MNYYERHIGDYLKDTAHLSLLEHGVYTRLLDVYYTREGAIPSKDVMRLVGARTKDEKAAVQTVLSEFFVMEEGGDWVQPRCEREIRRYQDKCAKARASINARWDKSKNERSTSVQQEANERNTNVSQTNAERNTTRARPQTPDTTIEAELHGGASAKPPRATRKCPADFVVTEAMADWAKRECPSVPLTRETAAFRDHTFKTAISDWQGAWRNWVRRASQFAPAAAKATTRQTEVAKWLGPLAQQPKQGEIIDMEDGHGPRIAMG